MFTKSLIASLCYHLRGGKQNQDNYYIYHLGWIFFLVSPVGLTHVHFAGSFLFYNDKVAGCYGGISCMETIPLS